MRAPRRPLARASSGRHRRSAAARWLSARLLPAGILALAACTTAPGPTATVGTLPSTPFPLGEVGLAETRSVEQLAPGLYHHHVYRGGAGRAAGHWTVSGPVARTPSERAQARACLESTGVGVVSQAFFTPGGNPKPYAILAGGEFPTEAAARAAIASTPRPNCRLSVQHSSGDPQRSAGPWSIHVLEVRPRLYRGRLISALGQDTVAGTERTSDMARRHQASAAINGGFFVIGADEGVPGEPAGLAVLRGKVLSEPTLNRPYLLLRDGDPVSAEVVGTLERSPLRVRWGDGARSRVDGVNRQPGLIRNCGVLGSLSTERPVHDATCSSPDELIAMTEEAGFRVTGSDAQALLIHPGGKTEAASPSAVPGEGQILLVATGKAAIELADRAQRRPTAVVDLSYRAIDPRAPPRVLPRTYVVNGGPHLIEHGAPVRRDDMEGWLIAPETDATWASRVHSWVNRRNPRTAAGVAADGTIYLLTVDGREFEGEGRQGSLASVGMTIEELRLVMAHLGAHDAINLDGGGSTTLIVRGRLMNKPSDKSGERPVGDAILLPARQSK